MQTQILTSLQTIEGVWGWIPQKNFWWPRPSASWKTWVAPLHMNNNHPVEHLSNAFKVKQIRFCQEKFKIYNNFLFKIMTTGPRKLESLIFYLFAFIAYKTVTWFLISHYLECSNVITEEFYIWIVVWIAWNSSVHSSSKTTERLHTGYDLESSIFSHCLKSHKLQA